MQAIKREQTSEPDPYKSLRAIRHIHRQTHSHTHARTHTSTTRSFRAPNTTQKVIIITVPWPPSTGAGPPRGGRALTLQLLLRLPEPLQLSEVLVENEHLGEAERGHGGRRALITLRGRAALCVKRRPVALAYTRVLPPPAQPPLTACLSPRPARATPTFGLEMLGS